MPLLNEAQIERFWSYVTDDGGHLIWHGPTAYGVPQAHLARRPRRIRLRAYAVAWSLLGGRDPEPDEWLVRDCSAAMCINPEHFHFGHRNEVVPAPSFDERVPAPYPAGVRVAAVYPHTCDTPPCCNPSHLFLGTPADNSADMVTKGRAFRARGLRNPNSILTADRVIEIRRAWHGEGLTARALGERFGIDTMTAWKAAVGGTYPDVPMPEVLRKRRAFATRTPRR